jgi:hypothetical protein
MADLQNYSALFIVVPIYVSIPLAFVIPAPWNIAPFAGSYVFVFVWVFLQPKVMKWISQGFKQKWAIIDSSESLWRYVGRLQWWFKRDPAMTSQWLEKAKIHQTFVILEKPFRHPYYNNKRRIWGVYLRHGGFSFDHRSVELSEEEEKQLSSWDSLCPDKGGMVAFGGMWVYNPNSDSLWLKEVMPNAEQLRRAQEAVDKGITLKNHIPIVVDGVAYPVYDIMRATGSAIIEEMLEKRRRIAPEYMRREANGNYQVPLEQIIEVPVK